MPKFPESARFAVVGDSTELFARAPLRIGNGRNDIESEDLTDYFAELESESGKQFGKGIILVSGNNPAILDQNGNLSPYSTLLDNHDKLVEGIKSWHKVMQLGPVTPEGGKFKARKYQNGQCEFDTGHSELSGDERYRPLATHTAFDAAHLLEAVEELGLGETHESQRGLLARFNGLHRVNGQFEFSESRNRRGRQLCINNTPVVQVEYNAKGEPNVFLLYNDRSIEALERAYKNVPATLSIGLNRNFGPITFVANYVPVTSLEDAAQTPLSMEVETSKFPLVVPFRQLGQAGAPCLQYDGKEIKNVNANTQTTITTMGMYAGSANPKYWQDLTGMDGGLERELDAKTKRASTALYLRRTVSEQPVKNVAQTFAFFKAYGGKRLDEQLGHC